MGCPYKAVEADKVGVRLATGGTLHSEGVKVWVLLRISRLQAGDTIPTG
jgi:hypothetical protein